MSILATRIGPSVRKSHRKRDLIMQNEISHVESLRNVLIKMMFKFQ